MNAPKYSLAAACALALAASPAWATLTLDAPVISGNGVTVTGSGSLADGYAELFVNGVSQGSTQADGAGAFSFENLVLTDGDELEVRQSRVWNFNTDGNPEGWISTNANGTVSVAGGDLVLTADNTGVLGITPGNGLDLDPSVYRVWEIRMRNNTSQANYTFRWRGTNTYDGTNVIGFVGMPSGTGSDYQVAKLNPDYNFSSVQTSYQSQPGGLINSVRYDFDLTAGDQLFIDYVRVTESWNYEFDSPGDTEMLSFTRINTPTVANGEMTYTLSDANPNIEKGINPPDKSRLDASYFRRVTARGAQLDVDAGAASDRWNIYFDTGAGFAGNNIAMNEIGTANLGLPMDDTPFEIEASLADDVDFPATGAIVGLRLDTGTFSEAAGDQVAVDYLRIGPDNPYGPSPVVTVTPPNELQLSGPLSAGNGVSVSGSGAPANGWVELHQGLVSLGSVQADANGDFTFPSVDLLEGEDVFVTLSRVWNFNTNGDTEGWVAQDTGILSVDAQNGALVLEKLTAGNGDLRFNDGIGLDPSIYRVWEFRINNPTTLNNFNFRFRGTNPFDTSNVIGIVGMPFSTGANEFQTVKLNPDYDFSNAVSTYQAQAGTTINGIRLDFGHAVGETIRIDQIRAIEYYEYDFANDGDTESLDLNSARGVPTVAGGTMSWTLNAPGPTIQKANTGTDKTRIDPSYFTHVAVGGTYLDANAGATADQFTLFFNPNGAGFPGNVVQLGGLPTDGTRIDARREIIDADPDYAANPPTIAFRLDPGTFNTEPGDTVTLDYWRLEPEDPYGPSAPLTVQASTGLNDWQLF